LTRLPALAALALTLIAAPVAGQDGRTLAAPGLVEPGSEEREIGSEVIGIIREMRVDENDRVTKGQLLAVIENTEQQARLALAEAERALRRAELDRLVAGARLEERREARAALAEADALLALHRREYERRLPLVQSGTAAQASLDQATANLEAARARRAVAGERLALIEAPPRVEDLAAARARLAAADANVALAAALVDKTLVRAPIDGVILRRQRIAGEAVGNQPPTAIATIGDLTRLRVRAEVDEIDLGRVALGQRVEVAADAFPGARFGGVVTRVNARLGAKTVSTGRPRERADTKVLQVVIDLDPDVKLPVGLRVDVFFQGARR
jgi:HlyD family secretion protein